MDRFNSLMVFFLLSFFAVSLSAIVSPANDHDALVSTTDERNSTTSSSEEDHDELLKNAEHHFTKFVKKYGKTYADEEEHAYRLSVFKSNLRRAKHHQKLDPTAVHGITQFSDLTLMEFRRNLLGDGSFERIPVKLLKNVGINASILPTNDLPADFDWRDRGVVTPVKDQGGCASSYAFSAVGAIEAAYALATGKLVDLSEQEIIDCEYWKRSVGLKMRRNQGCLGGNIENVFAHVLHRGFVSELVYPYTSGRSHHMGSCRVLAPTIHVRVGNFSEVNPHNEDQIAANLVKYGPLAVIMGVNLKLMSTYTGGVSCPLICPGILSEPEHGLVLVGYSSGAYSPIRLKKEPYWILKNSWSTNWGEEGYYRTCKGNDDPCRGFREVNTVSTTSSP